MKGKLVKDMEYNIGDVVRTKKEHPCGSKLWELVRVGVDFKLKCLGCGHIVTLERQKALLRLSISLLRIIIFLCHDKCYYNIYFYFLPL